MGDDYDLAGAVDEDIEIDPESRPVPRVDVEYESDESKTDPPENPLERHTSDS